MSDILSNSLCQPSKQEIIFHINSLENRSDFLTIENQLMGNYLRIVEPSDVSIKISHPFKLNSHNIEITSLLLKKKQRNARISVEVLHLSFEQKCDIASYQLEVLAQQRSKKREEFAKKLNTQEASIDEAEMALVEDKKSKHDYDRLINQCAINKHTGLIMSEKITKYFEDKLKNKDSTIEKLRLKNSSMRSKLHKIRSQLKQKEEMGEILHQVDFDQLRIEYEQDMERIMELYEQLMKLKLESGNANLVLNSYKKKLFNLTNESDQLKNELKQRNEMLTKISHELNDVNNERGKSEISFKILKQQLSDFKVPYVMSYIKEISNLDELKKTVNSWERKIEIARLNLNATTSHLDRILTQVQIIGLSKS